MVVKCPVCGAHVPAAVAVEIPVGGETQRFCSLRCAESADAGEARTAPLPPLPAPPRRILVAVDGSGPSVRATELAATLASLTGGEVDLLHAIDPRLLRLLPFEGVLAGRIGFDASQIERELREDADTQLRRCRRICEQAGVKVSTRIEVEQPTRAISEVADAFDLVVMGSRGHGAISGAAVGSLSHRVIGATDRPVLIVH